MVRRTAPADPSIGQRIKERRESRNLSIRHAADLAGIAHTTWSRIEKGEIRTDRYVIADIATVLDCTVTELTGRPRVPGDRAVDAAHATVPSLWLAIMEIAPDMASERPPLPIQALRDRMDLLYARRSADDYAAAGGMLPDLLRDLHAATAGPDWREALRLLVSATHQAGGTLGALGYRGEGAFAGERARQLAEQLDEPLWLAVADYSRARSAVGNGSLSRAHMLVTRAIDALAPQLDDDPAALAMFGMLHLQAGHALAPREQDRKAELIAEAGSLAVRTGELGERDHSFGPTNVGIWRVGMLVDCGEPGQALDVARTLNPSAVASTASRAFYWLDTARALAETRGGAREAERSMLTAERLAPVRVRNYAGARSTAQFLRRRLPRGSAIYGLCERMNIA
jgi:transcriptional regulator with XRE-family HTH domain